jgi:hypothetical protein
MGLANQAGLSGHRMMVVRKLGRSLSRNLKELVFLEFRLQLLDQLRA